MKKTILAGFIIVLYIILSTNIASAGLTLSKHDGLSVAEQEVVDSVSRRISNIIIDEKNCDAKIRISILKNIDARKNYYEDLTLAIDYKKYLIYATIEREVSTQTLQCIQETVHDDYFFSGIVPIETPQPSESKKGAFHSNLGANVEVRTSTSYIYFYHEGTLFNTIDKKFKNDEMTISRSLSIKPDEDTSLLDTTETHSKIGLYTAEYLDMNINKDRKYIHFTKEDDTGTKSFIYYITTDTWFDFGYNTIVGFGSLRDSRYYILTNATYKNYEMRESTNVYVIDPDEENKLYLGSLYRIGTLHSSVFTGGDRLDITLKDYSGGFYSKKFNVPSK